MNTRSIALISSLPFVVAACSGDDPGPRLSTTVAPLQLAGIGGADYTITVRNGSDEIVWQQTGLTSDQYGDGRGGLTYVGTCDASDNPNSVELVLEALYDTTGAELVDPTDYRNPGPQTQTVVCKENADVAVVFDITLMRAAKQGFFDVAVNFEDIFCSAKADCVDAMLHQPDGERGPTAIVAFACTTGVGQATFGYITDLQLTCVDGEGTSTVTTIPVGDREDGQQGAVAGALYQWAQYSGREFPGGSDFNKCFRNYALGIDLEALAGQTCTLDFWATASSDRLPGNALPADATWPVIHWSVELVDATGDICEPQALDAVGSGVTTTYLGPSHTTLPRPFATELVCGQVDPEPDPVVACAGFDQGGFTTADVNGQTVVSLAVPGNAPLVLGTLPPDTTLAGCCVDACCGE